MQKQLSTYLENKDNAAYRLMIRLSKDGKISLSDQPLEPLSADFLTAQLSLQKKDVTASPFTYFKTSYRPHIEQKSYEQVFYNQAGQLLETSIGNLLSSWVRPSTHHQWLWGFYQDFFAKSC